jgi:CBS domain-containing protein
MVVVGLKAGETIALVRVWLNGMAWGTTHLGFPGLESNGLLLGVVTRRDLAAEGHSPTQAVRELIHRPPVVVYDDCTLRDAADHMVNHDIGRLPVISREHPDELVGFLTRSDVISAHRRRLDESHVTEPSIGWPRISFGATGDQGHAESHAHYD